MADKYDIYLEVQRGGWDSQRALQNANPSSRQFQRHVNAADLVKVFGAGWLGEAGMAFGKNPPFLPEGAVFKRIVATPEDGQPAFGIEDLYAAYLLQEAANSYDFGRGGPISRRQSRFVFYMVAINLLKDVMNRSQMVTDNRSISIALSKALADANAKEALLGQAIEMIDTYFTQGGDESVSFEPALLNAFNGDLNAFMKSERLGKSMDFTPKLFEGLTLAKMGMGRPFNGQPSARQIVTGIIAQ